VTSGYLVRSSRCGRLIARNAIRGQQNSGILLTGTDVPFTENRNVTIQNNQAVNNSTFVNMFRNNTNIQIRQNTTNDTIVDDNVDQGTAIRIADNANGVFVSNNTIRNSPFSGVAVRDVEFSSFGNPDNIDIQFNRILSPEGNGVDVTDVRSGAVSVFKNTIRHADLDGIVFSELTQNTSSTPIARRSAATSTARTSRMTARAPTERPTRGPTTLAPWRTPAVSATTKLHSLRPGLRKCAGPAPSW
jgi:hypothetical protein